MPSLILIMIAGALAFGFWNAARAAAEQAEGLGRDACNNAGVQWLDQSVHANGLRLYRKQNGWLGLERSFRFEYSHDGVERHSGRLIMREGRLVAFVGPVASPSATSFE